MGESENFSFKPRAEITPKRFEAIVPAWEELLGHLSIPIVADDASQLNRTAIDDDYEEKVVALLVDLYREVSTLSSAEEQVAYIQNHTPLRLALLRARAIVAARSRD